MKNTEKALRDISLELTRELRNIIIDRDHVDTGLLVSNITVEAVYNPLAHKTSFSIVYNAPYYFVYVDALSPKKNGATWTTTISQELKQSQVYSDARQKLLQALQDDLVPLDKTRKEIDDIIGGAIKVKNIRKYIISKIKKKE